jgi:hypothetical protein
MAMGPLPVPAGSGASWRFWLSAPLLAGLVVLFAPSTRPAPLTVEQVEQKTKLDALDGLKGGEILRLAGGQIRVVGAHLSGHTIRVFTPDMQRHMDYHLELGFVDREILDAQILPCCDDKYKDVAAETLNMKRY